MTMSCRIMYRGADKSLAQPTSRCILFDGQNISFDANLVIYINTTNIHPIMIINTIYETQNLLSLQLVSFLVVLTTYQHLCRNSELLDLVNNCQSIKQVDTQRGPKDSQKYIYLHFVPIQNYVSQSVQRYHRAASGELNMKNTISKKIVNLVNNKGI